jgi:D-alanyl-D-alanine endopeptidase (penicillin-binding protein 7)
MFEALLSSILVPAILFASFPTDGAQLEARASAREAEIVFYGDNGGFSHTLLQPEPPKSRTPIKTDVNRMGVVTTAPSLIVVDNQSGAMLYGERPYDLRAIGSVTKLMAAMVFLDQKPDLARVVSLNNSDLVLGGRAWVSFNEPLRLSEVLAATLIASDNSAARSLMRFSGLTAEEFVEAMNIKARELGMGTTRFTEPTGIDARNVSTAHQLVKLLQEADKYPEIVRYSRLPSYQLRYESGRVAQLENTNVLTGTQMLDGARVLSGKTGFLPQAGYVLVTSVESRGKRIDIVLMGASSIENRAREVRALAEWTFESYKWPDEL